MKLTLGFLGLLAISGLGAGCGADNSANDNLTPRKSVVETNVNQNLNANNAPSNVGVLTNDNGNKNTAGISTMNANATTNHNGKSHNGNN
jgi:hypothetical protein